MNKKLQQKIRPNLPLATLCLLALLPIPRVVMHDLHLMSFDSVLYKLFAATPLLIWAVVAIARKTKRPFADFMTLGLAFGLFLALTHQLLWHAAWGGDGPHIPGQLAGQLSPFAEAALLRTSAVISSLATGLVAGLALSFIAWASMRVRTARKRAAK